MGAPVLSPDYEKNKLYNWLVPALGYDAANNEWRPVAVSAAGSLSIGGTDAAGSASTFGTTSAAAASGTLTSDATAPSNNDTVTIGTTVYTYVSLVQGTTTLTSDNTAPADGSTVTIGNKTYTFKTTLTPTEGEVLINITADAALLNLIRAINHTGTPNTDYKCAAAHTQVSAASSVTAHAFLITALDAGTAGNVAVSASTTAPSAHITFTAATLTGGTDPTVDGTVKIGVSAAVALDNLKAAVNLDAGQGTLFFITVAHPTVSATTNTDTTQLFVAKTAGSAGNAIATTETSSHLSFGAATLTGGANATLVTAAKQFTGAPSNFAVATADQTVFTLAAGERGFIQNLDSADALAVKYGASASTSSFSMILSPGSAQDDGKGGSILIDDFIGIVSVATLTGTARYIAWKEAP